MKRSGLFLLALVFCSVIGVLAQTSISGQPFYVEVTPTAAKPGRYRVDLPLQVMDRARSDLADLRLYDKSGREIQYALRIRRDVDDKREITGQVFNKATTGATASEISIDLKVSGSEHNEVEISTAGSNFRRRVDLDGSDNGTEWHNIKTGDIIFRFQSQTGSVEVNRINYPTSRYRYIRARVFADDLTDKQAPVITDLRALMTAKTTGQLVSWMVPVPSMELLRNQGAPASSWAIDLGGKVPCDRLAFEILDNSFSRPFLLENVDDPDNVRQIATGELTRRVGEPQKPLVIFFNQEERVGKLRLLITDNSNQTLLLSSITASAPLRQIIFDLPEGGNNPLRLFFGNQKAAAPHYDYDKNYTDVPGTELLVATVNARVNNPSYTPEPLPFTERVPWLIYIVLSASTLALALILFNLARTTLEIQPQVEPEAEAKTGVE